MKKFFTLSVLAFAMMVAIPANAQKLKFGVKGGLNYSNTTGSFDVENKAGFFIGPTVKLSTPLAGLSFDAAALYDQRSYKPKQDVEVLGNTITVEGENLTQKSIQIPVNVRYGIGLGSSASAFIFAGPQWGFNVGGTREEIFDSQYYKEEFKWKKSTFSVNIGVGVSLLKHLQATVNYNIACGKSGESEGELARQGIKNARAHNHAWQIGVAYFF